MTVSEILKEKMEAAAGSWDSYFAPEIPRKKLENAAQFLAGGIPPESILGLIDGTIRGSAKDGLAFTETTVFSCTWGEHEKVDYVAIKKVEVLEDKVKVYDEIGLAMTVTLCDFRKFGELLNALAKKDEPVEKKEKVSPVIASDENENSAENETVESSKTSEDEKQENAKSTEQKIERSEKISAKQNSENSNDSNEILKDDPDDEKYIVRDWLMTLIKVGIAFVFDVNFIEKFFGALSSENVGGEALGISARDLGTLVVRITFMAIITLHAWAYVRGFAVNKTKETLTFAGSIIFPNSLAGALQCFKQFVTRTKVPISSIKKVYIMNHYKIKNSGKIARTYRLHIIGEFGSTKLFFFSENKCEELFTAIEELMY